MQLFSTNVAYASVDTFVANVNRVIVNPLIGLIFAVALVYFLYGVFMFIANADNEEKRTDGKSHMIYGVIGMTIMMGVFGILSLVLRTFNLDDDVDPQKGTVDLDDYTPTYPPFKTN